MTIKTNQVAFRDLNIGHVFEDNGAYLMKIRPSTNETLGICNAVSLVDGQVCMYQLEFKVIWKRQAILLLEGETCNS